MAPRPIPKLKPFRRTSCLTFRPINHRVQKAYRALSEDLKGTFAARSDYVDGCVLSGRPVGGRFFSKIRGSKPALFEMRLTPPGSKGEHVRVLYAIHGDVVLCVRVVCKKQRAIPREEIALAERDLKAYVDDIEGRERK